MGPSQQPSVGRIVHYKRSAEDTEPLAAIITVVRGSQLTLTVFLEAGDMHVQAGTTAAADFAAAGSGEWCWPARV